MQEKIDKQKMEFCMEMAKKGIDLEKLFKDLEPIFEIINEISALAVKNYKFLTKNSKKVSSIKNKV